MKKNICVYTCVTGTYDELKDPNIVEDNIDYYCFTNNKNIKSNIWKIIYIEDFSLTNHLLSRKIKTLGHDEINGKYDAYVWLDASIIIKEKINKFIDKFCNLSKYDFFTFKHNCRNSILEEMKAVEFYGKESIENIEKLKEYYKKENYLYDNGLGENGVIIRNYNDNVMKTMKLWFDMLVNYSGRDQLSFNYAAKTTNLKFNHLNMNIWENNWFEVEKHNCHNHKYYVHFKKELDDDIEEYERGDKIFNSINVINNIQKIDITVPKKCKYIDIELSGLGNYIMKDYSINSTTELEHDFIFFNLIYKHLIFNNDGCKLQLNGNFDSGDKINIKFELIPNKENDILQLIKQGEIENKKEIEKISKSLENFEKEKEKLKDKLNKAEAEKKELDTKYKKLNKQYKELVDEYTKIINSKRWKLANKVFDLKK